MEETMTCNQICQKYKAIKIKGKRRYEAGQKRCMNCAIFIWYDGLWCPCCNKRLRMHAHHGKTRKKYVEGAYRY